MLYCEVDLNFLSIIKCEWISDENLRRNKEFFFSMLNPFYILRIGCIRGELNLFFIFRFKFSEFPHTQKKSLPDQIANYYDT